ncbi:family 16 glycosylhydrolase [Peribacillus sp. NPDC097198]|uniref:glycoside hydrolase family 16 protein n=1 Tax=Peribacillus sp. NPDC097198 TaxID=3364397 RepID=UPI0038274896
MKKVLLGIITALLTIGCGHQETDIYSVTAKKKTASKLLWSDEFDTLDKTKWNLINEPSWKPAKRKQYYLPRNLTVKNGILTIHVKKENYEKDPYTSGALYTENKQTFHYGRLEIRAKIADGKGLLSALWLQPLDRTEFPEIDIMEVLGQEPNRLWNVVHWEDKKKKRQRDFTHTDTKKPLNDAFHVYGIIWTKEKLTFTLDGKVTHTMTKNVPQKPMYLTMNVSVGGQWATDPSPKQKFPKKMQIDYVRYYSK